MNIIFKLPTLGSPGIQAARGMSATGVSIPALLKEIGQLEKLAATSFCCKLTYVSKAAAVKCKSLLKAGYWLDVDFIPDRDLASFKEDMVRDLPELSDEILNALLNYHHKQNANFIISEEDKEHYMHVQENKEHAIRCANNIVWG